MQKPIITFQTLAYNAEDYIAQTIESVLNQTEKNIEYYIRDNGSTDKTFEICKAYAKKDKRLKLIQNKNNHKNDDGSQLEFYDYFPIANGEYVSFLDSDDYIHKDYAKIMYEAGRSNNASIVVGGTRMFHDGKDGEYFDRIPPSVIVSKSHIIRDDEFCYLYGSLRPLWGKLFKRDFFEKNKFDVTEISRKFLNGGDTAMSLSFFKRAELTVSINKALHYYRCRSNSTYNSNYIELERIKDGRYLFETGLDLLAHLGILQANTLSFLCRVHFSLINDLVNLCFNSSSMTMLQKLNFFEEVINDDTLNIYALNDDANVFATLMNIGNKFFEEYKCSSQTINNSFLVRLIIADSKIVNNFDSVGFILLLSSIFDSKNRYLWGKHLFKKKFNDVPKWVLFFNSFNMESLKNVLEKKSYFRDIVNLDSMTIDFNSTKKNILDAVDSCDYEIANNQLDIILKYRPLDREALYFKIYVSYQIKDLLSMNIAVALAEMFWFEDEEIMTIVNNMKDMEKEGNCYYE